MKEGYVYLIYDSSQSAYKIGKTKTAVEKRIKQLQTGNANELRLINYFTTKYPSFVETSLHKQFNDKNVMNEWFDLTQDDVDEFEESCNRIMEMAKVLETNHFGKEILK